MKRNFAKIAHSSLWAKSGILGVWAILLVTMVATLTATQPSHAASEQSVDVSIEVLQSCSITSTGSDHVDSFSPVTFQDIGKDSVFDVACNDKEGYVVYAVGDTNDKEGTTDLVGSGDNKIQTGTATEGDTSTWSFKISNPSEGMTIQPGFDQYSVIPARKTAVVKRLATTQDTGIDHFNVSYGIYVAAAQAPDTYQGKVLYTLFHPNTVQVYHYKIEYKLNSGSGGPTKLLDEGDVTENVVNIDAAKPERSGYEFLGWCDQETTSDSCPGGHLHESGSTITLESNDSSITLWAVWKQAYEGIMQEWDNCSSLGTEQPIRLLDNRDNNIYTVTKLKDGKCWMTENLRITGDSVKAAGVSADLDSTNTDISGVGKFTIPDDDISKFSVGSDGINTTGGKNNDAAYVETVSYSDPTYGAKNFDSGYYTWHTATAGTGTADQTTKGWNAPSSICSRGWKLPTGGSGSDFYTLANAYGIYGYTEGSNPLRSNPLNFTFAGYVFYSNGSMGAQGSFGYYWSSTVLNQDSAITLFLDSSFVNPTGGYNRPYGYSVRCVKR